jgi:hypothetical protein
MKLDGLKAYQALNTKDEDDTIDDRNTMFSITDSIDDVISVDDLSENVRWNLLNA